MITKRKNVNIEKIPITAAEYLVEERSFFSEIMIRISPIKIDQYNLFERKVVWSSKNNVHNFGSIVRVMTT